MWIQYPGVLSVLLCAGGGAGTMKEICGKVLGTVLSEVSHASLSWGTLFWSGRFGIGQGLWKNRSNSRRRNRSTVTAAMAIARFVLHVSVEERGFCFERGLYYTVIQSVWDGPESPETENSH